MYNEKLLSNNKMQNVAVVPGEIYWVEKFNRIDKSRPVLVISDQETATNGILTCLEITARFNHPGTFPIILNGTVSFVVPYQEFTMTYDDLFKYGKRMAVLPMRILEMIRYMKFRIYGTPHSEPHEKAIFEHGIKIFRDIISSKLELSVVYDNEVTSETFLGGRFARHFTPKAVRKFNNEKLTREGDSEKSSKVESPVSITKKDTVTEINATENYIENDEISELVYRDSDESFNNMGNAILKAIETGATPKRKTVAEKKKDAAVNKSSHSKNRFQRRKEMSSILKDQQNMIEQNEENSSIEVSVVEEVKSNVSNNRTYFETKDGKVVIKKVKDMTLTEMSNLLSDVKNKNSYTNFAVACDMTITTIKSRCLKCIEKLDELSIVVPDDVRTYFTTDQRVKNNYQSHTIETNMKKKGCGQFAASAAELIAKKAEKDMPSYAC